MNEERTPRPGDVYLDTDDELMLVVSTDPNDNLGMIYLGGKGRCSTSVWTTDQDLKYNTSSLLERMEESRYVFSLLEMLDVIDFTGDES